MRASGLRGRPRSIRFWLTLPVVACILPAAAGAMFLLVRSYDQERAKLDAARLEMARALTRVVDSELTRDATMLRVLALSPSLGYGDLAGFQERASRAVAITSGINIVLSRPDGAQIINTMKPFGDPLPRGGDGELQRLTMESETFVISNLFKGPLHNQSVFAVQVPVAVDGAARYTLAIGYSSRGLGDIMKSQNIPDDWVAAIIDRNGIVAARTQAADEFVGRRASAPFLRDAANRPEGMVDTVTLEGTSVRAVFSRSALSGWMVAIAVPTAVTVAGIQRSLWLNAAGAAVVLLMGATLARLIGRRITESIRALGVHAQTQGGDGALVVSRSNIIEVDALRTVLLEARAQIERRVLERDAAREAEHRMTVSAKGAEAANLAKSRFLTGMTHELRTPLHGILGYAELLSLEGGLNATQAERVAAMIAAGEHLLGMINGVLDLAQIEADRLELYPVEIELTEFSRACLDVVRPAAAAKGLALGLAPAAPLRIPADPTRLRQVLLNLLGNAIKFTPSGAVELRLQPTADGAFARLEVADTGPGIWLRHRDKLFQTFERLNANAVGAAEGTGLGLSLAARLVKLMDGRIGYADNPKGGSVFWVELPVNGAVPQVVEAVATAPAATSPALRVLVVDDDALNRRIATGFLEIGGHGVVCLDNGAAAVAAATAGDFDVILMDVRMAGMNGLEATRLIRALPAPRGTVPVVAATAQAYAEQIAICHEAGMDGHVSKPFRQKVLLAAVEAVARARNGAPEAATTAAADGVEPGFPILDRAAFEDTVEFLPAEQVEEHLRTLIARGEALLPGLRASGAPARDGELAEAAHLLAGGAATFGFLSLAHADRRFEFAADSGAPETAALAARLAAAIDAAIAVLREELAARATAAP